jgi:glutathionyl-hydroquinone reductase
LKFEVGVGVRFTHIDVRERRPSRRIGGQTAPKPQKERPRWVCFLRKDSTYRNWVTVNGAPGPTGHGGYPGELGRYHLYVSLACPWAHRTLILRSLKGLGAIIPVSVVHWRMLENGWTFEDGPGVVPDPNLGAKFLYEIYIASDPNYTGRVTVPVLWDKRRGAIVNNESSEIIRMMNCAFNALGATEYTRVFQQYRPTDGISRRLRLTLG